MVGWGGLGRPRSLARADASNRGYPGGLRSPGVTIGGEAGGRPRATPRRRTSTACSPCRDLPTSARSIKGPSLCTLPNNGRGGADQAAQLHAKGAGPACRQSSAAARQQSADSLGESEGDATPVSTRDRIGQRARRPGLRETAGGELFPKPLKNDDYRPRAVDSGMGCRFIASACVSACDRPPGASFVGREKFAGAARATCSRT